MENFGNSFLGLVLALILLWAFFEPDEVGEWVNEFRRGMTGSTVAQ